MPSMPSIPSSMVKFVLPDGAHIGQIRNAIATLALDGPGNRLNLSVFVDAGDYPEATGGATAAGHPQLMPLAFLNVPQSGTVHGVYPPGTWH